MTTLADLFPLDLLREMLEGGYVRRQQHPTLPLQILNYTERATYDGVWNPVTLQCRGLIHETDGAGRVVARPFPKFFNYGEHLDPGPYDTLEEGLRRAFALPVLDLDAPAVVTDKLDGSLGILYPTPDGYAVATRGSFASDQALHATEVWKQRYEGRWHPVPLWTYLFEIVYPENRIVCDYGDTDDLVFLAALSIETGCQGSPRFWPGPRVAEHHYATLGEALAAEPRPNAEGLVVAITTSDGLCERERVKIKQSDYVALHRILTGTNARNVWEVAAVHACAHLIHDRKHWGTYLGMDPARAEEVQALGDDWLADVPDEFYAWVRRTIDDVTEQAQNAVVAGIALAAHAEEFVDPQERHAYVLEHAGPFATQVLRLARPTAGERQLAELRLRAWREATPEPTAPFARAEDVA